MKVIVKDKLIKNGVKNLHEFGYPSCNIFNILTDPIYSEFFISMLKENQGVDSGIDLAINELLDEIRRIKSED